MFLEGFYRGDTVIIPLVFTDEGGEALNITGYTFWLTMKSSTDDADDDAALQVTVSDHTDPSAGKTTITLSAEQTAGLEPGKYYYDIQMVSALGVVTTLELSKVKVSADVTRSV